MDQARRRSADQGIAKVADDGMRMARVIGGLILAAAVVWLLSGPAAASPLTAGQGLALERAPGDVVLAQGKYGPPRGPVPPRVTPNFNKQSGAAPPGRPPSSAGTPPRTGPRTGLSGRQGVTKPFNQATRPPVAPRRPQTAPRRDTRGDHLRKYNQPRPIHNLQPRKGWPGKAQATRGPANKLYQEHRNYLKGKLGGGNPKAVAPPKMAPPKLGNRGTVTKPFNHHSGAAKAKPPAKRGGFSNLTLSHRNVLRSHFNSVR